MNSSKALISPALYLEISRLLGLIKQSVNKKVLIPTLVAGK